MELVDIAQIVNALGTIGVLLYFTYAFVTGRIVSNKVHEEQVRLATDLAIKVLSNGFKEAVRESVKLGFIEAWHEISIRNKQ